MKESWITRERVAFGVIALLGVAVLLFDLDDRVMDFLTTLVGDARRTT